MLTQEKLKEILHYCPDTGVFTWRVNRGPVKAGTTAGAISHTIDGKKYAQIQVSKKLYRAHRLAFLYMAGFLPKYQVDHQDGNGLNNRWDNLRDVEQLDNAKNVRKPKNNTSGTSGVCMSHRENRWRSFITVERKQIHLGYFSNIDDAIKARKSAEIKYGFHANHGQERPL